MLNQPKQSVLHSQKGSSLIEVMVSFLVLAFSLLGMVGMQTKAVQLNQESFYRSQASGLAYEMLDRLRANRDFALNNNSYKTDYDREASDYSGFISQCSGSGSNCTQNDLASYDLAQWKQQVEQALPKGEAMIQFIPTASGREVVIGIKFDASRGQSDDIGTEPVLVRGSI